MDFSGEAAGVAALSRTAVKWLMRPFCRRQRGRLERRGAQFHHL